jgi:FAD/FMN-containing dehydrogenase
MISSVVMLALARRLLFKSPERRAPKRMPIRPAAVISAFLGELDGIAHSDDPAVVAAKSRDMYAVSPLLRRSLRGHLADAVVSPRDKAELARTLSAAVRHRVPLTPRGGGTANYGQSVPLSGGAMLDMTGFSGLLWHDGERVRVRAGTLMTDLDRALRQDGVELRIHPSTRDESTVGGFIAGGSGGMGSCAFGMLRDPGNILGVELMSVEETPRLVELRGEDCALVQHAYGTTGVITGLELPLAPAHPWIEAVIAFPDLLDAAAFGIALAAEAGIAKKLISVQEWPVPRMMRALGDIVPDGCSMAACMVARRNLPDVTALAAMRGGQLVVAVPEGEGPYGAPLYEFSFGHALRPIQKAHPRRTVLQGMFPPDGLLERLAAVRAAVGAAGPMRFEIFRSQGALVGMGSPYVEFESEAQLADIVTTMQALGVSVANSHVTGVRAVGIKRLDERDAALKRAMDPHGLLNPGKGLDAPEDTARTSLGTRGWAGYPAGSSSREGVAPPQATA